MASNLMGNTGCLLLLTQEFLMIEMLLEGLLNNPGIMVDLVISHLLQQEHLWYQNNQRYFRFSSQKKKKTYRFWCLYKNFGLSHLILVRANLSELKDLPRGLLAISSALDTFQQYRISKNEFFELSPVGKSCSSHPNILFQAQIFHLMEHLLFHPIAWTFGLIRLNAADVMRSTLHQ